MNKQATTRLRMIAVALFVAAGLLGLVTGVADGLLVLALGIVTLGIAELFKHRPRGQQQSVAADDVILLREQRDQDGEIAAIRALRSRRPDLTLVEAVKLVRGL
ncbi:MAG: hypothetical protein ACT4RN_05855 [Pseudonocardia sp.]